MKIFVAGATGALGRRIVPMLVAEGHSVTAIARTAEKGAHLIRQGATPAQVSLFDEAALRGALERHEVVINVATAIPASSRVFVPGAWRENKKVRGKGAPTLVRAAHAAGVTRFIQESYAPIYADAGDRWIDESSSVRAPRYNHAVIDAEQAALSFTGAGRTGVVLRFANFYGPDSSFTADMIGMVRKGWAPVIGDAAGYISSVSHDDAASAVIAALRAPAGIFNVADDEPLRKREFFDALARALGANPPKYPPSWLRYLTGSIGETLARSLRISNAKLKRETGWSPEYQSAREGWPVVLRELSRRPA